MEREVISTRQMMVLLLVALLGPTVDLLPGVAAARGGWVSTLVALPVLLGSVWAGGKVFCRHMGKNCLGKSVRYTIIIMYMLWSLIVLAAVLRLSVVRMETVEPTAPSWLFGAAVALMAVWMATGKISALARAAEVFYLALTVLLTGILLLAIFQVEWENVFDVDWEKLPGGGAAIAGVCLSVAPVAALGCAIPEDTRSLRKALGWTCAFGGVLLLLAMTVIGSLSDGLCRRMEAPFLIMVQGLRIKGAFQRTEALVAAMCLLSDVVFAGALLRTWAVFAEQIVPGQPGKKWLFPVAVVAAAGGWALLPKGNDVRAFWGEVLWVGSANMG